MSMLGVAEAAAVLGVSSRRVRQMLTDGVLPGEQVGRVWVIDPNDLDHIEQRRPLVGRPWSSDSAWAVLALADGEERELSPLERSRAKKRLSQGLGKVAGRLAARADLQSFYAHPGVVDRLAASSVVVRGGISAAAEYGADLHGGDGFEGYVKSGDLHRLIEQFGLDAQSSRPNVRLRAIDDALWPFDPSQRVAGRAVVAVDLLESSEARSQRAGVALLESR